MSNSVTMAIQDEFMLVQCPDCCCWFGVPVTRMVWFHRGIGAAKSLCCPNGHAHIMGTPDPDWTFTRTTNPPTITFIANQIKPLAAEISQLQKLAERIESASLNVIDANLPKEPVKGVRKTGERVQCPNCQGWYKNKNSLKAHMAYAHKEPR